MQRNNFLLLSVIVAIAGLAANVNGAAYASDNTSIQLSDINFGTALQMLYNAFQKIMPCGYPPMKLPILAPFTMGFLPINLTNEYYNINGNISNMVVTGMSNFRFIASSYNEDTNRTTYDLIFPELQILGEFMLDAWALMAGFPVDMASKGLLNVKVVDFRMVGEFEMATSALSPDGLRISDFDLHFYVGNVLVNNWNSLWDISANNFFNRWMRDFSLMWAQQIQVQVDSIYAQLLLPIANGYLENVTMNEFIDMLVELSMEFNMANCTLA